MSDKEFDMDLELAPRDAAFALGVTVRTVTNWLNEGKLGSVTDFKQRKRVRISDLFKYADDLGIVGQPADQRMRERLRTDILPKYEKSGAEVDRKNVLVSV